MYVYIHIYVLYDIHSKFCINHLKIFESVKSEAQIWSGLFLKSHPFFQCP